MNFNQHKQRPNESVLIVPIFVGRNNAFNFIFTRSSGYDNPNWKIPGGHEEMGETPEIAAKREREEEIGLSNGLMIHKPEWLVEKPSKHHAHLGKLHKQHVFLFVTSSMVGFKTVAVDGTKTLTNRVFTLGETSKAVSDGVPLEGHYLLRDHSSVMEKVLTAPNFGIII